MCGVRTEVLLVLLQAIKEEVAGDEASGIPSPRIEFLLGIIVGDEE